MRGFTGTKYPGGWNIFWQIVKYFHGLKYFHVDTGVRVPGRDHREVREGGQRGSPGVPAISAVQELQSPDLHRFTGKPLWSKLSSCWSPSSLPSPGKDWHWARDSGLFPVNISVLARWKYFRLSSWRRSPRATRSRRREKSVISISLQEEHRANILEQLRLRVLENIVSVGRSLINQKFFDLALPIFDNER